MVATIVACALALSALPADARSRAGETRQAGSVERPLVVCTGGPCDEGRWEFALDPVLGALSATIAVPSDESWIELGMPWGVAIPLHPPSPGSLAAGSVRVDTTWVEPTVVRLDMTFDPTRRDWPGSWSLTVVDPVAEGEEAAVSVTGEGGVVPRFPSPPRLVDGRATTVSVELADRDGRYVPADDVADLVTVTVEVLDATGAAVATSVLAPDDLGGFAGELTLPEGVPAGPLEAVATLAATTNLVALPEVVVRSDTERFTADAWPHLGATAVTMRGDGGGTASGGLAVVAGPAVDACVWVEDGALDLAGVEAVLDLAGAVSPASCVVVPAGESRTVPLRLDLDPRLESGLYGGTVVVGIGSRVDDSYDLVELAVSLEVHEPVDLARRILLTVLMSLVGLGLPVTAVWLFDFLRARFRPSRRAVIAEVPVLVRSDDSVWRADTGTALLVGNDMFEPAELRRGRRLTVAGLTFFVHNPRSPLRPPVGVVSSPTGPVVASEGVVVEDRRVFGRVPLTLRDTWIFELDPERTRRAALDPSADDFQAAYGRLVLLRASVGADPIRLRRLPRRARQLARQLRSSGGEADASAQDMLAFVDVNVSAPRDLPRATRPALEAASADATGGPGADEFAGFEGAITFDDFEDPDELDRLDELDQPVFDDGPEDLPEDGSEDLPDDSLDGESDDDELDDDGPAGSDPAGNDPVDRDTDR